MQLSWLEFKTVIIARKLPIQWVVVGDNYWLKALDGYFSVECFIPVDEGNELTADFVANYKSLGNVSPKAIVTTQSETRDKTLKLAHGEAEVGLDGIATILLKVPGTPGSSDGRWIANGIGFFDSHHFGDKVLGIYFTDEDNILGYGAGAVVGSYTDDDMPSDNQGWIFPPDGILKVDAVGGFGFALAGLYIKTIGKKGSGITTGTLSINLSWAKVE